VQDIPLYKINFHYCQRWLNVSFFFYVEGRYRYTDNFIEKFIYSCFSTLPMFEREGISGLKNRVWVRETERKGHIWSTQTFSNKRRENE
jgi:hypothetical protein